MVIGVSANGAQALRFDSVTLKPDQTLQSYVAAGWIEGVETTAIEPLDIAGQPGVIAVGKGTDWTFRLAAVQAGNRVYRFILAAKGGGSFRVLSAEEAQAVRPITVRIVTAAAGDTPATMAARMAEQERAQELFMVLNGIERGGALVPGQRYKIVAE